MVPNDCQVDSEALWCGIDGCRAVGPAGRVAEWEDITVMLVMLLKDVTRRSVPGASRSNNTPLR